jgi:catechol 2,3-dioxygenase-like lactoylglutathione lyase family enzyme
MLELVYDGGERAAPACIFDQRGACPLEFQTMKALGTRVAAVSIGLILSLVPGALAHAQQRPAITGIAFARMYSSNPPASDDFYKMLGLAPEPLIKTPQGDLQRFSVSDSQWVEVIPLPTPAPAARLAAVAFTTRNAGQLEKYLRAKGVEIIEPLKTGEFTVLDPEGNRVIFVQAGSHKEATGNRDGVGETTSRRIIHVGFEVHSADAEDHFYKEILGFHDYWHGGMTPAKTDWVSLQVPDGTDWLEYMLSRTTSPDPVANLRETGVLDHFSLGVSTMKPVVDELARNGCGKTSEAGNCARTQMGKDGKVQLNVFDPDFTRVEYMEFKPTGTPCCSEFKGRQPSEVEDK